MSVPLYLFHSLPLKLSNKGMCFPFSPLKLSNKGREEYSKMILFISFHSISFPSPKRSLKFNNYSQNKIHFKKKRHIKRHKVRMVCKVKISFILKGKEQDSLKEKRTKEENHKNPDLNCFFFFFGLLLRMRIC